MNSYASKIEERPPAIRNLRARIDALNLKIATERTVEGITNEEDEATLQELKDEYNYLFSQWLSDL